MMKKIIVKNDSTKKDKRSAFTLLEMVVVLFIISMLLLLIIPNLVNQKQHASKVANDALVSVIQTQVELYQSDNSGQVSSLKQLKDADYITREQLKRAEEQKITIKNGVVILPKENSGN